MIKSTLFAAMLSLSTFGFAQSAINSAPDDNEAIDIRDDEPFLNEGSTKVSSINLNKEEDDELFLIQQERREKFKYGFALGLGASQPWQEYYLEANYIYLQNIWFSYFAGIGDSEFNSTNFSIESNQKVTGVSGKWFFWEMIPFYLSGSLSYVWWDGSISPKRAVELGAPADDVIIRTGFDAQGAVVAVGFGMNYVWDSGFYIDYKLIGLLRSFVTTVHMHDPSSKSRNAVKNNFNKTYEFGIFNIKFGYLLK